MGWSRLTTKPKHDRAAAMLPARAQASSASFAATQPSSDPNRRAPTRGRRSQRRPARPIVVISTRQWVRPKGRDAQRTSPRSERGGEACNHRRRREQGQQDDRDQQLDPKEHVAPSQQAELRPHASRTFDISDFVDAAEIDPVFYDDTYWLGPDGEAGDECGDPKRRQSGKQPGQEHSS